MKKQRQPKLDLKSQEEEDLILWVRDNPILYNAKNENYKYKKQKEQLWAQKAQDIGCTLEQIKAWWNGLRTRYRKKQK